MLRLVDPMVRVVIQGLWRVNDIISLLLPVVPVLYHYVDCLPILLRIP